MKFLEEVRRDCLGPHAETVDAVDFLFLREVYDQRRDAAETHLVGLQHAHRDAGGDSRIDRVAAAFEDLKPGVRREIMSRRNDVAGTHDGWTIGHANSPLERRLLIDDG